MENQKFGMLFDTGENHHYYFDAGTGKVISVDADEKEFIGRILNNQLRLEDACSENPEFAGFIKQERLFDENEGWHFARMSKEEFREQIEGRCSQIVLELTEQCNLRCGYCIYNDHHPEHREFSDRSMRFEDAKKSIDALLGDFRGEDFSLTFYGGEPLLNFDLMRRCIDYTSHHYSTIRLAYGFTTNLTLLTKEMVDYFKTLENINIMCSLDGPGPMHDEYRRDVRGRGTFDRAVRNFRWLLDEFYDPEKKRTLSVNCVLTPPYKKEKLKAVSDFFYDELGIPEEIVCNYSYVDMGDLLKDHSQDTLIENEGGRLEISPLEEWAADDFAVRNDGSRYFDLISKELYRVANRLRAEEGVIEEAFLHGNCVPGQRRLYVTVNGDFRTCEKVGRAPFLGSCGDGYDIDRTYKMYIEDYIGYYEKICRNCWARSMCTLCYESTMSGEGDVPYVSGKLCDAERQIVRDMFINYYKLFETDREGLEKAISGVEFS